MMRLFRSILLMAVIATALTAPVAHAVVAVNLPPPTEWDQPTGAPVTPGDVFSATFTGSSSSNAPIISEWNRGCVKPDESFTLTGVRFTVRSGDMAGTDITVWIWGNDSTGGSLQQCKVWKLQGDYSLTATVPANLPFGQYLVWVENQDGASTPICLNKTSAEWIGPLGNTVPANTPGVKKRVFGRNLSQSHGVISSNVYLKRNGGVSYEPLTVDSVSPYYVQVSLPNDLPSGTHTIYVHNGHGGRYGWSQALTIVAEIPWQRGSFSVVVNPSVRTDATDYASIQNAIDAVSSQPNGGTVNLAAGTYTITNQLQIKAGVMLKGASMTTTVLNLANTNGPVLIAGDHVALQDLWLHVASVVGGYPLGGGGSRTDLKFINVKLDEASGLRWDPSGNWGVCPVAGFGADHMEMTGCEVSMPNDLSGNDVWVHDNTFYGGFYGNPYEYPAEAAAAGSNNRLTFERNHIATPNWPNNAGSRQYNPNDPAVANLLWARRVWLNNHWRSSNLYFGFNTGSDVAVQDNKGELFLFHGLPWNCYVQVASANTTTLTIRTDGKINGVSGYTVDSYPGQPGNPVTAVPDTLERQWTTPTDGAFCIIVSGTGVGQYRRIASHTSNSVTVTSPWRVAPAADSIIVLAGMVTDTVLYRNDINAFPEGYRLTSATASNAFQLDGNCAGFAIEGNVFHRTQSGGMIASYPTGPCYWNEVRDHTSHDMYFGGIGFRCWNWNTPSDTQDCIGAANLGNSVHGADLSVVTLNQTIWAGGIVGYGGDIPNSHDRYSVLGAVAEGVVSIGDSLGISTNAECQSVMRNNTFTLSASSALGFPTAASLYPGTDMVLSGNSYSGQVINYNMNSGSIAPLPTPLYRAARLVGYAGYGVQPQIIPIANAGTAPMTWTVAANDPWVVASVQSNGNVLSESSAGRLVITANTTGIPPGNYWSWVILSTGGASVKVGVNLSLSAGPPPGLDPMAVCTATPTIGTAPLVVRFDATASYDPDGIIDAYLWDFGDGTYGLGSSASHTYSTSGTFTPVLTVSDNSGASSVAYRNIMVSPPLTAVTVAGSPNAPCDAGTGITLTASTTGGYLPLYKFLVKSGDAWDTLRDYNLSPVCNWTPTQSGYYEVKVYAKSTDSLNVFDCASSVLSYPVGLISSSGMKLWLRSESGVTKDASGNVSLWSDQSGSGNSVSQSNQAYQPSYVDSAINGLPAVSFGGASESLQSSARVLTGTSGFTSFAVILPEQISYDNYQYIWWNGPDSTSGGYGCCLPADSAIMSGWGNWSGYVMTGSTVSPETWYRVSSRLSGTSHQMWLDGTLVGSASKTGSNFTSGVFVLGNFVPSSSYGFNGRVGEVIIYNRALSEVERAGVEQYLNTRWGKKTPAKKSRISDVRVLGDGVLVSITSAKVAICSSNDYIDGSYYIEDLDRSSGIKVLGGPGVSRWENVTLTGVTGTDQFTGERVLVVTTVDTRSSGVALGPLGMVNKSLRSSGQLVRVWGKVTSSNESGFVVSDGSGSPVAVDVSGMTIPLATVPEIGAYVGVTGPAGSMQGGSVAVMPRASTDIQIY